jgi:poly-gamma-glutamate synthesis protein (capsule biosynthesis protein)
MNSKINVPLPEFNWQSGQIYFPSRKSDINKNEEWSVAVCGDWAPMFGHTSAIVQNPSKFYGDLLPILQDANLRVLNLECIITDNDLVPIIKDGETIAVPSSTIKGLTNVPFDLACMANNHTFDFAEEGLFNTLEFLKNKNIKTIGAGLCQEEVEKPAFFNFGKTRVAFVNVAEGEEASSENKNAGVASLNLSRLGSQLPALKEQVDVLIVVVHAGREYLPVPAPYIRDIYRDLIDMGADLVIGHHPHVPQGIESYNSGVIVYSLGNFAFFMDTPAKLHRLGYFIKANFCGAELRAIEIWPYKINSNGLCLLEGTALASFLTNLNSLSDLIKDDDCLISLWNAYADKWLSKVGLEELVFSIVLLVNPNLLIKSILKKGLLHFNKECITHSLARRIIWRLINYLEHRPGSVTTQLQKKAMKQGASILRNRFDTLAHKELYLTALQRVMEGKFNQGPAWANNLLLKWEVFW